MIHNQDETDVITRLIDTVLQLSRKVEQLETTLASVTTIYKTKHGHSTRINTTALSMLQLLNNDVVPSMNMDAFMAFLANMPCDAESVVDKKSAEVIADLVVDGYRNLCAQYSAKSTQFIPPIINVSMEGTNKVLFIFDNANGGTWVICSMELFSQFVKRVHACVVIQCNRWREKNVGPPRPFYTDTIESLDEPYPERDPHAMAKHQKISEKIYSLNLDSNGLLTRIKKIIGKTLILEK
jgi:hypothetical protein